MTRDDIIKLAQKAGTYTMPRGIGEYEKSLERFAALVAAAEREACARVCEEFEDATDRLNRPSGYECAAAIRARREK